MPKKPVMTLIDETLSRTDMLKLIGVVCLLAAIGIVYFLYSGYWRNPTVRAYSGQIRDAVLRGEVEKVRQFLKNGTYDPDSRTDVGRTLLMDAVDTGHKEMTELLLAFEANAEAVSRENGETALTIAMKKNRIDIVKLFIDHGANVNRTDAMGDNVLMAAVRYGANEIAQAVLPGTTDLNQRNSKGYTALMTAAEKGNLSLVRLLLNQSVSLTPKNHSGKNALALAVKGGYVDVVQALLDAGAEIKNELDMAAITYDKSMTRLLLERGAPVSRETARELSDKAVQMGDENFQELLSRYGIARSVILK